MPGAGTGYSVDIEALQATVRQLRVLADSLENPRANARYDTTIPAGMLGRGFAGAEALTDKHNEMRDWLESMIGELQGFIERYGGQTQRAVQAYAEQERRTKQDFFSSAGSA
ncbi:hypothetical protein ABIA32_002563 [Streptacidiphilus sp. MAP12-20]|uniref:hypothetical protein n=1 Tax=Streptacidiphilus sp. MAP12-20 TaxID=3156299 RepID=UPI00351862BA